MDDLDVPVVLHDGVGSLTDLAGSVRAVLRDAGPDLDAALLLARDLGEHLPAPGLGQTPDLWSALATVGALDLTVARVVEPHLDARAILGEARRTGQAVPADLPDDATWGVFAAEGGGRLLARQVGERWSLTGHKPWCSLADRVSHALVTAWVDDERRGLFAVDLADPGVRPAEAAGPWVARGLAGVRSTGLDLDSVPAAAVGEPGWYLERPGFAWGGIGVASIWYGGAVGVARRVRQGALDRRPDQIALAHLGAIDSALTAARAVLREAATLVDASPLEPAAAARLALRVRQVVADSAEEVLRRSGHALGPGPLAGEESHARRVADLGLYLRQHHAERDAAALGASTLPGDSGEGDWW